MSLSLPAIWFGIICLEGALYMLLDGTSLGIGLHSLLAHTRERRSALLRVMGPMWDANETWLLIAAATTYGAFPLVYSVVLNGLYIPAMTLGVGLVLRVVSFEFYAHTSRTKTFWGKMFGLGCLLAVVGQGLVLGGILSGIRITGTQFSGGPFDWATPVTLLITIGLVMSYMVLGYAHLMRQPKLITQEEGFKKLFLYSTITFVLLAAATAILPNTNYIFLERWSDPQIKYVLWGIVGVIATLSGLLAYHVVWKRHLGDVYTLCNLLFVFGFLGIVVGIYPYILPPNITIFEAASSPNTQRFMLWGLGPILPIVLVYNYYIRRLFSDSATYEG